ncbi:MAG: Crp/Fnr family transcriptional regulator [Gammaproteobacteria bacterium]|nr:Crp/Fnr family transcriptional regulator [Gammaproteobacteria bacterium]MCP5136943.1 Crp/Fnr family transcriptional regulator [Gammaproteobacteria bacterium]
MTETEYPLTPEALQRVWLFEALDHSRIAALISHTQTTRLKRGESLFQQGDRCDRIYLLVEGQLKLYRLAMNGEEKVVDLIQPGQSFAEAVAFLDGSRMPVAATALSASTVYGFDSAQFLRMLRDDPDLCFRVMAVFSRRLHQLLTQVEDLTLHNGTYRLANFLLSQPQAENGDVVLDVPKYVLASRLSIKPETLSRIFAHLRDEGVINVDGDHLRILDRPGLRQILNN